MRKKELIENLKSGNSGLLAILRGIPHEKLPFVAEALILGGVSTMEITFNQTGDFSETVNSIRLLNETFSNDIIVGAGTVMTTEQVRKAKKAGAEFVVSPNTDERVIRLAARLGMLSMPGALTPTEIAKAYACGGSVIKIFPAGLMGAEYIKAIKGPMPHIPIAAVGNITTANIAEFGRVGVGLFGISSGLVAKASVANEDYEEITENCRRYLDALKG